jgi:hypothetical protein
VSSTDFYSTSPRPWPAVRRTDAPVVAKGPAIELRILGGWTLCRGERLIEAIDLAEAFGANRVLYNWWGWVPGERLTQEDERLVLYARERGIELICELRRMSFGKSYRIDEPGQRRRIVDTFLEAAQAGFRSFGLLFDDVEWETPEDECALVVEIRRRLTDEIGHVPEMFTCPQHYWYPGQMSLDWTGAAGKEETAKQRRYLEVYGRELPADVHVYIANYWGDAPDDYATRLREEYTELVGRKPVFFDNQLINDYRLGAIFPFALHQRPGDFDEHVAGYVINAPRPLAAYAPSIASALQYARSPRDYDPETTLGSTIEWMHGSGERAAAVLDATNRLRDLANDWADGEYTATNHYRTIWRQVREGRADRERLTLWRAGISQVKERLLGALEIDSHDGRAESTRAITELSTSCERLGVDLTLFDHFLASTDKDPHALQHVARKVREHALAQVAGILPRVAGFETELTASASTDPEGSPAWSWFEYFYRNTEREIDALVAEMGKMRE